ncbi:LuxR C-terminal-related transcriptional regulator [Methylobacterium dankookense]|uniref:Transcriptional regulatory protein DegU n=1 Tax=Methylobacterium dankookense TaxID=560405 RepID=A0A564FW60_9HYPH|nr:response regulator transcription factor [Methylobacterium dankookense]GJD55378.1 Transcriptional regulatory protein LnrK [Methylobacterium dankookense]VUF12247.1 Transcriptional regulatory protein DegU [Methylobacterium dankookense]
MPSPDPSADPEPAPAGTGLVAVVADDDEFFRMAIAVLLKRHLGFAEVIETGSLDAALADLAVRPEADLALFDLRMPGMAGAFSLTAVRECFPTLRTAIVSASRDRNDILLALAAGSHGYIPKASGAAEMVQALHTVLAGGIFVPASLAEGPFPAWSAGAPEMALTPRQRDVLAHIVEGRTNKEIARALDLGEGTVKIHVAALLRALGVANRAAAASVGHRLLGKG